MSDDHRPVPLEPKANDPGERRVDNPKPHPFPGLHSYTVRNPAIDRDGIADAAGHPRFHTVAETGSDASTVVQPPILDEPQEIAVNSNRFAFLYNECPRQPAPQLLQRVGVGVVPEGARIGRRELVGEALARTDRRLREPRHAVHRVLYTDTMPV